MGGTFLSNKMCNAMALGVYDHSFHLLGRKFELLRDFRDGQAIIEIIDYGIHWHTRSTQDWFSGLHPGFAFNELAP